MFYPFTTPQGQPIFLSIEENKCCSWLPEQLIFHLWQPDDDSTYTGLAFSSTNPCNLAVDFYHEYDNYTRFTVFQCDHYTQNKNLLCSGVISPQKAVQLEQERCKDKALMNTAKKLITACLSDPILPIPSDRLVWQGPKAVGILNKWELDVDGGYIFPTINIFYPNTYHISELRILPEEIQWWPEGVHRYTLQKPIPEHFKQFFNTIETDIKNMPEYQKPIQTIAK